MADPERDEKGRLRASFAASLRTIPVEQACEAGRLASRRLDAWPGLARKTELVAYSSLPGEVDSNSFFELAHIAGMRLLLPRIIRDDLEFASVPEGEELIPGRYGIREPRAERSARRIGPAAIVLVPGIAFDSEGGRLGRGAGYYDRALASIRLVSEETVFVGVGFQSQIIERLPMDPHDVRMDGVLTEKSLVWVDESDSKGRG